MPWGEFSTLLAGIMPNTPLGQVVSIRSEEDKEMLKNFTPEQRRIRNEWRSRQAAREFGGMTDEEKAEKVKEFQKVIERAFGKEERTRGH
jgi:hypothetical protein